MTASAATHPPLAVVFGGSGFIGRYIVQRLARRGWRVRVAVRRPNEALFVKPYGYVGQVDVVQANIRDEDSCRRAVAGADSVVYSVGVLFESGKNTFSAVQKEGPGLVARLAREADARRFTLISAIGADAESDSGYARSKAKGEAAARAAFPEATILRPSVVFGPEDDFFNRFAGMARISPILPLVGAETKFQPVHVEDVARAAVMAAEGEAEPGETYELGGPRVASMRELMEIMARVIRREPRTIDMPRGIAAMIALASDMAAKLGVKPPLTRDQLRLLARDNVVAEGARGFADLGIVPTEMAGVLEGYLWPFRPYGQYERITRDAKPS